MKRLLLLTATTLFLCSQTSCIMAARKGLGTIVGPKGTMTITMNDGTLQKDDRIGAVSVRNISNDAVSQGQIRLIQEVVEASLRADGIMAPTATGISLLLQVTAFTDRPGKKTLRIEARLQRDGRTAAVSQLESDYNGFGSEREVAEAIGWASVRFLTEVEDTNR